MAIEFQESVLNLCGKARIAQLGNDDRGSVTLFLDKGFTKFVTFDDKGDVHSQFLIETGVLLEVADAIREELKRG